VYNRYWNLRERPFANLPDLRFACMTSGFEEGLARLRYAVREDKGLALLVGPPGSGKTFLLEKLRRELSGDGATVLKLVNPNLKPMEMLRCIFNALRSESGAHFDGFDRDNKTDLLEAITIYARQRVRDGARVLLLVDDAQTITDPLTVEELRLLLNFCTESGYLIQLVLAGLPGLMERIRSFPSLCQRVDVSYVLEPMGVEEIAPYITHRLRAAGAGEAAADIFTPDATAEVYGYADGIPRLVNNVCDMALLIASGEGHRQVDAESVIKAAEDRSVPASALGG